jgi:hypothetical protein
MRTAAAGKLMQDMGKPRKMMAGDIKVPAAAPAEGS